MDLLIALLMWEFGTQPFVLVVDDVQWMDSASLQFVSRLLVTVPTAATVAAVRCDLESDDDHYHHHHDHHPTPKHRHHEQLSPGHRDHHHHYDEDRDTVMLGTCRGAEGGRRWLSLVGWVGCFLLSAVSNVDPRTIDRTTRLFFTTAHHTTPLQHSPRPPRMS